VASAANSESRNVLLFPTSTKTAAVGVNKQYHLQSRGVSNSSRTELFTNFSEKARVCQVRTFFLSLRTVRVVCLPVIPLHNKQYNRYIFVKNDFFFFVLVRSAYFSSKFRKFSPNYSRTSSRTVRFGSVRKCISSSSVRFEDLKKCTPLLQSSGI
jgi:hypothetical protein